VEFLGFFKGLSIISNILRLNSGSWSRKEENAVVRERNLARLGNGAAATR